ncbi:hypothetical protein [Streptomyces sp. NPDC127190]|uniref:hypothetical protein n=1 Tax=unclassified Streptomyces TaxID=2593676 RepID=UPI003634D8FA
MATSHKVKLDITRSVIFLAAAALLTGCSGGTDKGDDHYQSADQVCGGLSESAAHTLETVADTKKFSSEPAGGFDVPANVHGELKGTPAQKQHVLCSITPEEVRNEQHINLSFKVLPKLPPSPDKGLRGNVGFKVGLRGQASDLGAHMFFRCGQAVVETDFRYAPASRGLVSYKGNMQLLNEASYRLAQQLSCLGSSGLAKEVK